MNVTPDENFWEAHIGYWLRFVSNHVSNAFRLKVEAHGVLVADWVVLRMLYGRDGIRPSDLADRLGMTRGGVSKLVDRLMEKGLVKCRVEAEDRRYQTVILTAKGGKLVPVLTALADQNDAEFFGCLTDAQRSELVVLMKRVIQSGGLNRIPME